jgi:hypothetical protein
MPLDSWFVWENASPGFHFSLYALICSDDKSMHRMVQASFLNGSQQQIRQPGNCITANAVEMISWFVAGQASGSGGPMSPAVDGLAGGQGVGRR